MELRDYQKEMLSRIGAAWERHRGVMVQMPTGTGKTVVLAELLRRTAGDVLVVAHRRELIAQITATLERFGISDGRVRVESIQRLARSGRPSLMPELVVIDEAHHAVARTYRQLWEWWPEARFLGLTATPCRLGGQGFTELFGVLLQSQPVQEFISRGWLSDFDYVSASPESEALQQVSQLARRGADGDYQVKEMAAVMDVPESVAHLYDTYREFARGRKGIVYAIDRGHARHIAEYYTKQGVNCAVIDARTPAEERRQTVEAYGRQETDVLVNVDIFSEGYDCPEVEFIQLARPTLSLSKYLQQVGRGMRRAQGKDSVVILDNVGLYQTFGLPTEERDWQQTFSGQAAGKGQQEVHRLVLADDERNEKTLVNLQMVRIKRRGEASQRLEVFMENGRYGVLRDGQVSCPPLFVGIRRMQPPFFVLGTYPYEVYGNRRAVIGDDGKEHDTRLYGRVEQYDEWLAYTDEHGQRRWWDGIGRRSYGERPQIERVGSLDVVSMEGQYMLRRYMPGCDIRFRKEEVLVGPVFCIFKNLLVYNDGRRVLRVVGYQDDYVIVDGGRTLQKEMKVRADGSVEDGQYISVSDRTVWPATTRRLGLRRLRN